MENISVDVQHSPLHPDSAILKITGFIHANTLVHLDKILQSVLASMKKKLVLDLSETSYVSSGGWGLIITYLRRIQEEGGNLVLAGMNSEVCDAFELLEYHKVLGSFPSAETALKEGFKNPASQANR